MFFRGGGGAHGAGTHPVLTDVMPLNAGTLQTEAPFAAAGAVRPREVTGLADDLPARFARAPELGAVLHVRAGLGAHPESQLTLLVQAVTRPRKVFGQRNGFGRLVQQAVSCGSGDGGALLGPWDQESLPGAETPPNSPFPSNFVCRGGRRVALQPISLSR